MSKFRQCLTELSACDTIMAGYYTLTFLLAHLSGSDKVSFCDHILSVVRRVCVCACVGACVHKQFLQKATYWILTKLHRNDPWLVLFQSCSVGSGQLHI